MKYLVIGQGSMGKRRVRCLLANKVPADQITVFDTRQDRLLESKEKHQVNITDDFEAAIQQPLLSAVFVSVPGALHMQYCLAAARAGKHWFCEVPLSLNLDGLEELRALTADRKLVGAPGCQVLFHPLARALKGWTAGELGGAVLAASYAIGMYLPEWHPFEDYRKFYAANKAMGGGNLDVLAQELVWICQTINRPVEAVTCREAKTSSLELADGTPDQQAIIIEFADGPVLSMHFDLIDRTHERTIRLAAENSTVKWSNLETCLHQYDTGKGEWTRIEQPADYHYESCYHEEIGAFLDCIENEKPWLVSIDAAEEIIRVIIALGRSAATGRTVQLSEVR